MPYILMYIGRRNMSTDMLRRLTNRRFIIIIIFLPQVVKIPGVKNKS